MAKPYSISITNGEGQANVVDGSYSVSASSTGYDGTSIDPSSITVSGSGTHNFEISASGTLTLHVSEDKTSTGTSVVGAKFIRCDSLGNTYGSEITTDSTGNAVFSNVPYDTTNPPVIYYKQTASDGEHNFDDTLKTYKLYAVTATEEILNEPAALQTVKLTDKNYENLPIEAATITLD